MPIYEYRCRHCGQKNTLFRPSIAEAETAQTDLRCERCDSADLQRLFSRFATGNTPRSQGEEIYEVDRLTADLDD